MILFCYTVILNIKDKYFVMGNLFIPLIIYLIYNLISILWTPIKSDGIQGIIIYLKVMKFIILSQMDVLKF